MDRDQQDKILAFHERSIWYLINGTQDYIIMLL